MAQVLMFLKIIQDGILPQQQQQETIRTTNFLFRLHTKITSTALILTSALLFVQQFLIDHMKCFRPEILVEAAVLNQHCFASETFAKNHKGNPVSHQYFQWVPFILLFQGILFFLPQFIWKKYIENGRLESTCSLKLKPDDAQPETEEVYNAKLKLKAIILSSRENRKYLLSFVLCELLNWCIVFSSLFVTDWLLQGHFQSLGIDWAFYVDKFRSCNYIEQTSDEVLRNGTCEGESPENPLEAAFPTSFTCRWEKYDPIVGNPETKTMYNIHCILGLNASHQRIYLVFWFWLILLLTFGVINFIYRFVLFSSPTARAYSLTHLVKKKGVKNYDLVKKGRFGYPNGYFMYKLFTHVDPQTIEWVFTEIFNKENGDAGNLLLKSSSVAPENDKNKSEEDLLEMQPISAV